MEVDLYATSSLHLDQAGWTFLVGMLCVLWYVCVLGCVFTHVGLCQCMLVRVCQCLSLLFMCLLLCFYMHECLCMFVCEHALLELWTFWSLTSQYCGLHFGLWNILYWSMGVSDKAMLSGFVDYSIAVTFILFKTRTHMTLDNWRQ